MSKSFDPVETTVRFCRALRHRGLLVGPGEAADALQALMCMDLTDREDVFLGLRTVLTSRHEDFTAFQEIFDAFWSGREEKAPSLPSPTSTPKPVESPWMKRPPRNATPTLLRWVQDEEVERDSPAITVPTASDRETLATRDFRSFRDSELDEIQRLTVRIARRLAYRISRRWKKGRGTKLDFRRTLRRSLRSGGHITELLFKERKRRKVRLIALCDVSGSMDLYSVFLLQFLYALQNSFATVETFVFSTRLHRVTPYLKGRTYAQMLRQLRRRVTGWSGGTRIGWSLVEFLTRWPTLLDRRSIVLILSDGWDTDEPQTLARALWEIQRRAARVIWLNPLLGNPSYQPLTRGMQAALPYVDIFAPLHNLESLRRLEHYLT